MMASLRRTSGSYASFYKTSFCILILLTYFWVCQVPPLSRAAAQPAPDGESVALTGLAASRCYHPLAFPFQSV